MSITTARRESGPVPDTRGGFRVVDLETHCGSSPERVLEYEGLPGGDPHVAREQLLELVQLPTREEVKAFEAGLRERSAAGGSGGEAPW